MNTKYNSYGNQSFGWQPATGFSSPATAQPTFGFGPGPRPGTAEPLPSKPEEEPSKEEEPGKKKKKKNIYEITC